MEHSILRIRVLFWLCIFLFCACIIICDPLKVDILSTYDTPQEKDALPCIFRKKRDSLLASLRFVYIYIKYIYIYIYIYIYRRTLCIWLPWNRYRFGQIYKRRGMNERQHDLRISLNVHIVFEVGFLNKVKY